MILLILTWVLFWAAALLWLALIVCLAAGDLARGLLALAYSVLRLLYLTFIALPADGLRGLVRWVDKKLD